MLGSAGSSQPGCLGLSLCPPVPLFTIPSQAAWHCPCVPLFTIPSPGSDSEHREMDFRLRQECAGAVYHRRLTRNVFSRRNCPKPCFSCYFNGCRALNDNLLPFVFLIFFFTWLGEAFTALANIPACSSKHSCLLLLRPRGAAQSPFVQVREGGLHMLTPLVPHVPLIPAILLSSLCLSPGKTPEITEITRIQLPVMICDRGAQPQLRAKLAPWKCNLKKI